MYSRTVYSSDTTDEVVDKVIDDLEGSGTIGQRIYLDSVRYPRSYNENKLRMFKVTVEEIPYDKSQVWKFPTITQKSELVEDPNATVSFGVKEKSEDV